VNPLALSVSPGFHEPDRHKDARREQALRGEERPASSRSTIISPTTAGRGAGVASRPQLGHTLRVLPRRLRWYGDPAAPAVLVRAPPRDQLRTARPAMYNVCLVPEPTTCVVR